MRVCGGERLHDAATCGWSCSSWLVTDYSASAMALNSPAKMSVARANGSLEYAGGTVSGTRGLRNEHPVGRIHVIGGMIHNRTPPQSVTHRTHTT
jgi:hypothetical protein